jgi:hypothetical protein
MPVLPLRSKPWLMPTCEFPKLRTKMPPSQRRCAYASVSSRPSGREGRCSCPHIGVGLRKEEPQRSSSCASLDHRAPAVARYFQGLFAAACKPKFRASKASAKGIASASGFFLGTPRRDKPCHLLRDRHRHGEAIYDLLFWPSGRQTLEKGRVDQQGGQVGLSAIVAARRHRSGVNFSTPIGVESYMCVRTIFSRGYGIGESLAKNSSSNSPSCVSAPTFNASATRACVTSLATLKSDS